MTMPHPSHQHNDESDASRPENTGGRLLKQARLSQGISVEAVHEATKIPMDALKAIEDGYKVRSLSPFYLRGFMKIYAKYLGLDPNQIIAEVPKPKHDFEMTDAKAAEESVAETRASMDDLQREPITEKLGKFFNPDMLKTVLIGLMVLILVVVIFRVTVAGVKAIGHLFAKKSNQTQVQKENNQKPAKVVKEKPKKPTQIPEVQREQSVPAPAAAKTENAESAQKTQVTLTVRAAKDSWFQVKADGKMVFQSTMRAGRSESWTAKESLEVSGKNINQLEYEVNGRFIGALGRKDRQAKKLVITKDGMAVTQ